ncbi:hypothetical protein CFBP6411_01825 [Pseudomonas syringae group genomosp. 3]|uniref:Uncharacterized protein n=1 Tax=Pseudomonas syringae group genomosp. 3 TaxID=251701 RepID=A0A2K4WBD6_9PSED|nr:hypothetical protein CFBP6411_01825 [Pseudomonas syringae group genomosp. 3]
MSKRSAVVPMSALGSSNESHMKNVSPALQNSAGSEDIKLKDVVFLSRQFQRSVRLDIDFEDVAALRGYICQGTARSVLETTARHIEESSQRAFTWTGPFGGGKSSLAVALCSLVSNEPAIRQAALETLSLDEEEESYIPRAFSATGDGWLVMPVVGNRSSVVDALVCRLKINFSHACVLIAARARCILFKISSPLAFQT